MTYIKLFVDYLDAIEPLGDAERGRLFTALLDYARTGEAPRLSGNERFIFPMMKAQLDRDAEAYAEKEERTRSARQEAGRRGGLATAGKNRQAAAASGKEEQTAAKADKEQQTAANPAKDKDEDKDKVLPPIPPGGGRERKRFVPPTVEEVRAYCEERQNGIDAGAFVDFYTSKGWIIGKSPMKDWMSAVRSWERKRRETGEVREDSDDRFFT